MPATNDGYAVSYTTPRDTILRSPSSNPHAEHWFWIGEGDTRDWHARLQITRHLDPKEPRLLLQPTGLWDSLFVDCHKRGRTKPHGKGHVGCDDFAEVDLHHCIMDDAPSRLGSFGQSL